MKCSCTDTGHILFMHILLFCTIPICKIAVFQFLFCTVHVCTACCFALSSVYIKYSYIDQFMYCS